MPESPASQPADRLIVALDFPAAAPALRFVDRLDGQCLWFKVGLELFLAEGPAVVTALRSRGFKVFLDLKLHDIPNTVAAAVRLAALLDVALLTVHASGGPAMLRAAQAAAAQNPAMRLLAVTVLTSMDQQQLAATGVSGSMGDQVLTLARLATESGVAGLVCSPQETALLRNALGVGPLLVVPGIRPAVGLPPSSLDDQRRTATPAQSIGQGASMIVVGRPITRADDPSLATRQILADIEASAQSANQNR